MSEWTTISKVGMIGCGNMGSAIIKRLSAVYPTKSFLLFDKDLSKSSRLASDCGYGTKPVNDLEELLTQADTLFIGVKPKDLDPLLDRINHIKSNQEKLWISMVVGRSLNSIQSYLPVNHSIIRIMPNTPVVIGEGFVSYCYQEKRLTQEHIEDFLQLLAPLGTIQFVEEEQFDIASAIAGSGPAFIYQLIEAMSDAGVYCGLNRKQAIEMAAKTVRGSGQMVIESQQHPGQLKDAVTSPKGTTIAGVRTLEANGFRSAIIEAILSTYERR